MTIEPKIAWVDPEKCSGCFNCMEACPFDAIISEEYKGKMVAKVRESVCHGCGNCASTCRTKSVTVKGFSDEQIYAQIEAPFFEEEVEVA